MYLRMRIDGTPTTTTWPLCPPDANSMYSSGRPDGVYVLSAAVTSASLRLRAFIRSVSEPAVPPPPGGVLLEPLQAAPPVRSRKPRRPRRGERGAVLGWCMTAFFVAWRGRELSLIHISEPTRRTPISYAVF